MPLLGWAPCIQSSSSGAPPSKEDLSHRLAALQLTIDDYKEGRASSAYPRTWVVARRPDPTREFTVLTLNLEADSAKDVSKLAGRRARSIGGACRSEGILAPLA